MSLLDSPLVNVPLEQLAAMKIIDRFSVVVSGLPTQSMDLDALYSDCWFGAFGEITGICIFQNNPEYDAHLTFKHQQSATNAISWCNGPSSPSGLCAKNGHRRYCREFIFNQRCRRLHCHEVHEWQPSAELLNHDEMGELHDLNPPKNGDKELSRYSPQSIFSPPRNDNALPAVPHHRHQTADDAATEMLVLQKSFNELQEEFEAEQLLMNEILREIHGLQLENANLRRQNLEYDERSETGGVSDGGAAPSSSMRSNDGDRFYSLSMPSPSGLWGRE